MKIQGRPLFALAASALLAIAIACASAPASPGEDSSPTPDQPDEPELVEALAPIESVEVQVAESFPPQYFLLVTSGLPNSCVRFNDYEVTREGNTVNVEVTNLEPAPGESIACAMVYSTVETSIALGSDFEPDTTYEVVVNDFTTEFTTEPETTPGQTGEKVSEPAPIESVRIEVISGPPPQNNLIVVSALPNSCYEFEGYTLSREGDTIRVEVTNLGPASDQDIACAEIYRTVETEIPLGGDIEPCKFYTVEVNGKSQQAQAIGPAVSCPAPEPTTTTDTVEVLAPIESVEAHIAESFPTQYFLLVTSGLPNGCAKFNDYEVTREGDAISVKVTNLMPADPDVVCTQVYSSVQTNIALGSDFEPGIEYTVIVNDVTESFVAQAAAEEPSRPVLGSSFQLGLSKAALVGPDALRIDFLEVVEDSRCPEGVLCAWEGRAVTLIGISGGGLPPSLSQLTLQGGQEDPASQRIGEYLIQLIALEPHPKADEQIDKSDYVATLVVSIPDIESEGY